MLALRPHKAAYASNAKTADGLVGRHGQTDALSAGTIRTIRGRSDSKS